MCTYRIALNDSLVDSVRPAFYDDKDIEIWMQKQIEKLLILLAGKMNGSIDASLNESHPSTRKRRKVEVSPFVASIGKNLDLSSDMNEKNIYRDYLEEKYK